MASSTSTKMDLDRAPGGKSRAPSGSAAEYDTPKKYRAAAMKSSLLEKKKTAAVATTLDYTGKRPVAWKGVRVAERNEKVKKYMEGWMRAQGTNRREAAKNFRNNFGNVSNDRVGLANSWANYIKTLTEEEKFGLGADAAGLAKRAALNKEGFHTSSGGMGKYRPYFIENGIMRGGITGRGRETENGGFAIPAKLASDPSRRLQSVMAKYTDPLMFPATRMVKYVRGHWGSGARGNEMDKLW